MKYFILFFLFFILSSWAKAQDISDLGTEGGTCDITVQTVPMVETHIPMIEEPSFNAHLEKWTNGAYSEPRPDMLKMYVGKRVFVFGANDEASLEAAKKVKADMGLCVEYKNLQDLKFFREQTSIAFPVELANDYIVSVFNLKSYPVLVTVKENTVEYSSDF